MHRDETQQIASCSDCGAAISTATDRAYLFGTLGVLCWACAMGRGGRYDAGQERWSDEPAVADLLQADRGLR